MSKSFKNISVVAVATMASRVLGLGRDMLVTMVFGVESLASAFYTAFTLPNLFRRLLGEGALTAAFVPTLSEELKARDRRGAFALVNQVSTWLLVVSGGIVALAMALLALFPRAAGRLQAAGVESDTVQRWVEAADLGVILFPYLVCVCLAAAFSAALQTLGRFVEPALSPIWLNVAMITLLAGGAYGGWAASAGGAMLWLCAGALGGGFLQMMVPALALAREGWRPRFDLGVNEPFRQIVRLMAPTLFGSAIYLINISVSRFLGLSLNDSAVATLNLATRLMELPIGVFTVAVSTVVFPLIARHAAAGEWTQLAGSYRKGLRLILVINVPAAVGLMVLATPIIRVLFQRGAFDRGDTAAMAPVLVVFALGLPLLSFVNIVLRAFYALKDTGTPVRAAALSFVVNLALSLLLMDRLGTVGLAVASNAAILVQAVYLQRQLTRKQAGLAFLPVMGDLIKVVAAAGVMGLVVAGGWHLWTMWTRDGSVVTAFGLLLVIVTGIAVYGGLVWTLRIEGRDDLAAVLEKVRARIG
ncbi:MAG: murein biosynthesis integral membrane protein MurJ [Verrucomicrobia bacterium]|nr:murein biosynthesis integral membrane protein MurJ [Verrucomicrobiota bacterium]